MSLRMASIRLDGLGQVTFHLATPALLREVGTGPLADAEIVRLCLTDPTPLELTNRVVDGDVPSIAPVAAAIRKESQSA